MEVKYEFENQIAFLFSGILIPEPTKYISFSFLVRMNAILRCLSA